MGGIIVPSTGRRPKTRAKEIARTLRGMKTIKTIQKMKGQKKDRLDLSGHQKEKKMEEKQEVVPMALEVLPETDHETQMKKVREELMKVIGTPQQEGYQERLKQHLLDDVPRQFKKRAAEEEVGQMTEEQLTKRFRPAFFSYTMAATVEGERRKRANEWASKAEVKKLSTLLTSR